MELGNIIDYVQEYNHIHDVDEPEKKTKKEEKGTRRVATQSDWNALFG